LVNQRTAHAAGLLDETMQRRLRSGTDISVIEATAPLQ
jgi:hypothetical protein